jgi:hypothetical protein
MLYLNNVLNVKTKLHEELCMILRQLKNNGLKSIKNPKKNLNKVKSIHKK